MKSSNTKKILMSLAGLFLAAFLIVHLCINLTLLQNDGGVTFRSGVKFMTTNPIVRVLEIILFVGFFVHVILGVIVFIQDKIAQFKLGTTPDNSETTFFSKYTIHTGSIIGVFLVIHFMNFYFIKYGISNAPKGINSVEGAHDFYNIAINLFAQPIYSIIYVAFMIFLSFHLNHAIQSGFQTMGVNKNKYNTVIKCVGYSYSILIPAGFAIIPIYFLFFFGK